MALSIKSAEADALAPALAAETQESLTEAVTVALRERLERVRSRKAALAQGVERLQAGSAGEQRHRISDDEVLGYDQHGLPGCTLCVRPTLRLRLDV